MTFLRRKKIIFSLLIVLIISLTIGYFMIVNNKDYKEISYSQFIDNIEKGKVESVTLSKDSKLKGTFKDGTYFATDNPRTENFKERLLLSDVNVVESEKTTTAKDIIMFMLFIGVIGIVLKFVNGNRDKQASKEISEMSNVENNNDDSSSITFDDVAGNEESKDSLKELVDFIQNPDKYANYGARMPRGVLLYGPPGTGKTLLAKALAGEAKAPFFAVTGSDFIQVYSGLGASRIRSLFKKARQAGKCVIFIDEIDAIGKKRSGGALGGGNDESDRTLNALLTEMSGFKGSEGIIVIAATNRIDTLDEALLRPGRFDRQIEVGLPDLNARHKILKLHSKNKPIAPNVDLRRVAYDTVYFSGAKLESLMNESAMIAARNEDKSINMNHIDKAFYTVIAGEEKKDRSSISLEEKKITAYHEAGHALVTKLVSPKNRVTKITIIPSTKGAGGFSMNIPPDKMYQTKDDIQNNIMIALGGRAAEEIIFGEEKITTGASNDLQKVTNMALAMIGSLGMDKDAGLINYEIMFGGNPMGNDFMLKRTKSLIEELYLDTKNIIKENKYSLEKIADTLIKQETINEMELDNLLELKDS